jgi:hypothetical protein
MAVEQAVVRTCPCEGCDRVLGESASGVPRVICPRHWRHVPRPLQFRIIRSYRRIREAEPAVARQLYAGFAVDVKKAIALASQRTPRQPRGS